MATTFDDFVRLVVLVSRGGSTKKTFTYKAVSSAEIVYRKCDAVITTNFVLCSFMNGKYLYYSLDGMFFLLRETVAVSWIFLLLLAINMQMLVKLESIIGLKLKESSIIVFIILCQSAISPIAIALALSVFVCKR